MQQHLTVESKLMDVPDFLPPAGRPAESVDSGPIHVSAIQAENRELRAELETLRAERARLLERQRRMMDLLGTKQSEHLIHDLRNVLNERELLRTLSEGQF